MAGLLTRGVFLGSEPHALLPGSLQWILRMLDVAHSCGAVADSHGIPVSSREGTMGELSKNVSHNLRGITGKRKGRMIEELSD